MLWIALFNSSSENNIELAPLFSNVLESQINQPPILDVVSMEIHQAQSQAVSPGHQIRQPSYVNEANTGGDVTLDIPVQDSPLPDGLRGITVEHLRNSDSIFEQAETGISLRNAKGPRSSSRFVSMVAKGCAIGATTILMLIVIGLPQILEFWEGTKSCEIFMRHFAVSFLLFPFMYAGFKALANYILKE